MRRRSRRRQALGLRAAFALGRVDAGDEIARFVEFERAHRQIVIAAEPRQEVFERREPGAAFRNIFGLGHRRIIARANRTQFIHRRFDRVAPP